MHLSLRCEILFREVVCHSIQGIPRLFEIISSSIAGFLIGYIFGAFPTGYFAGRLWNVDVRKHGSGRTGGANVLRSAGWGAFAITVMGDLAKGIIPVLLTRFLFPTFDVAHALAVYGVLIGHNWSIWIAALAKKQRRAQYGAPPQGWVQRIVQKGRGGAGVAPTTGAVLALFPPVIPLTAPLPILILILTHYTSAGSITAALTLPFAMLYFVLNDGAPWSYFVLSLAVASTIILVHLPNIQRLRAGTERRLGERLGQRPRAD